MGRALSEHLIRNDWRMLCIFHQVVALSQKSDDQYEKRALVGSRLRPVVARLLAGSGRDSGGLRRFPAAAGKLLIEVTSDKSQIPCMIIKLLPIECAGMRKLGRFAAADQKMLLLRQNGCGPILARLGNMIKRGSLTFGAILGLGLFAFVTSGYSADWYVRPSSAGSNNGTDWNNAWNISMLNTRWSSVSPGDTVWLAGGTYTTKLTISKSGTSAARIYVKRVRATDSAPTAAGGWNPSFDALVTFAVPNAGVYNECQIELNGSYITFDGNTTNGVKVIMPNGLKQAINAAKMTGQNCVIQYVETSGPGPGVNHGGTLRFLAMYGSMNTSRYNWIHGVNQPYTLNGCNDQTIEYDTVTDNGRHLDTALYHDDIMEFNNATRCTIRYCTWKGWSAEGVMMWNGAGTMWIYGNVFINGGAGGVVWPSKTLQTQAGPVYFYNNTLINACVATDQSPAMGNWAPGSQARNNLYWGAQWAGSWGGWPMSDWDYDFGENSLMGGPGAHSIRNGLNPFVNSATGDYRILATIDARYPRNKGVALPAPFDKDAFGNSRGADGAWDMGAYEYMDTTGSNPVILVSPTTRDFGSVTLGATRDLAFTVQNGGGGTLAGTASVAAPFSVTAGGTYSLGANQSQTVTVRFSPAVVGSINRTVSFSGGGGATGSVNGIGASAAVLPPPSNLREP